MELSRASSNVSPIHPTSPVELMSTPRTGSAFCRRLNENCDALTPMRSMSKTDFSAFWNGASSMMRVAVSMRLRFNTLLTNGKERDARRLHSMTFTSRPLARNCILNGPEIFSSLAILRDIFFIWRIVEKDICWAGNVIVASPECTPAYSICSEMPYSTISPHCATPSNSISLVSVMNCETTTGYSFDTSDAAARNRLSSSSSWQTFIAAPERTYDGRTRTGYPTSSMNLLISSIDVSALHFGWSMPSWSSMAENLPRFSARSIDTGDVPRIGTAWRKSFMARLLGICPPTETTTPRGHSRSMTSRTRSKDSSSKYRRSHMS